MNCLFINIYMLIFFYVDDIVVLYEKKYIKQMKEFQSKFFQIYEIRYISKLQWFLEIRISRNHNQCTLTFYQNSYINKLIIKFIVNKVSRASKALLNSFDDDFEKNLNQATAQQILTYQKWIESINFVAIIIKSDIAFAASKLSEFLINSSSQHIKAVNLVLKYLAHIRSHEIVFNNQTININFIFFDSSNVSFADDLRTRHSLQKSCFNIVNLKRFFSEASSR